MDAQSNPVLQLRIFQHWLAKIGSVVLLQFLYLDLRPLNAGEIGFLLLIAVLCAGAWVLPAVFGITLIMLGIIPLIVKDVALWEPSLAVPVWFVTIPMCYVGVLFIGSSPGVWQRLRRFPVPVLYTGIVLLIAGMGIAIIGLLTLPECGPHEEIGHEIAVWGYLLTGAALVIPGIVLATLGWKARSV